VKSKEQGIPERKIDRVIRQSKRKKEIKKQKLTYTHEEAEIKKA